MGTLAVAAEADFHDACLASAESLISVASLFLLGIASIPERRKLKTYRLAYHYVCLSQGFLEQPRRESAHPLPWGIRFSICASRLS